MHCWLADREHLRQECQSIGLVRRAVVGMMVNISDCHVPFDSPRMPPRNLESLAWLSVVYPLPHSKRDTVLDIPLYRLIDCRLV